MSKRTVSRTSASAGNCLPIARSAAGRRKEKTVVFLPSIISAPNSISTVRPSPALATNCQVAGVPASNEARFFAFSGERNPSALTQTRMRLTKIQRSTGTLAFKFAPRTQSYLEFTRPKSTHIRAMPPMPLVKRTRSEDENEDEDDGEGGRKRIAAETRGEVVAQRSKISSASTAIWRGGKQAT